MAAAMIATAARGCVALIAVAVAVAVAAVRLQEKGYAEPALRHGCFRRIRPHF